MTDLSVIVVNWNTCELLAGCLKSLEDDFRNPQDLNIRIIVVDNASTDGSAEMVRARFPWVQLIENVENVGFARANNQAIRITTTPYVLLLNSDTRVHEGAFRTLVAFMETHPETGAAGPYLYNADGSLQPSCHPILTPGREFWRLSFADRLLPLATYPMHRWNSDTPRKVEVIKGACLLLRREALDQVGVLDEGFFMYSEEMDLCHRLLKAGWDLYWVPEARVTHYGEASSRQAAEAMYVQLYRSKVRFQRKVGGNLYAGYFKVLLALAYVPRWCITRVGALASSRLATRAHTYGRLLLELPTM